MVFIKELFYAWILLLVLVFGMYDSKPAEWLYSEDDTWDYAENAESESDKRKSGEKETERDEGEYLTGEEQDAQLEAELELMESETVLWMNATYAPLTYANGDDWRLVAGRERREENIGIIEYTIERDWGITDRESALESIEWLKEEGHTKQFEEWVAFWEGNPTEEDAIYEVIEDMDEDTAARALIVREMLDAGYVTDYIRAWDLCRVNQLYADCYLLGYMSFEEAMDCSLENSKELQNMYNSWEDMVNAYLMGYRFWICDWEYDDYGPTAFRESCYDALYYMPDSPYDLDWDLKLEKTAELKK